MVSVQDSWAPPLLTSYIVLLLWFPSNLTHYYLFSDPWVIPAPNSSSLASVNYKSFTFSGLLQIVSYMLMPIKSAQGTTDGWTRPKSWHSLGDSPDIQIKPLGFQVNAPHSPHFCPAFVAELHFFILIFVCNFLKKVLTVSSLPNQSRQCIAYISVPLFRSIYIGWERAKRNTCLYLTPVSAFLSSCIPLSFWYSPSMYNKCLTFLQ